jgi:NAD(P)-dependent dehydrogenase (short-subunit alcohol dehydrogenase family)
VMRAAQMGRTGILEGEAIAVTGAGRAIGRKFALRHAREGAAVAASDPGATPVAETVAEEPAPAVWPSFAWVDPASAHVSSCDPV